MNQTIKQSKQSNNFRPGFTLVEILVVLGIIAVLIGASVTGYSKMTKTAERAKEQELVSNTAVALTALFQKEGSWPKVLRGGEGRLDAARARVLASGKYLSLSTRSNGALSGTDRFGVLTPWGSAAVKRAGEDASLSTKVGSHTVQDHILWYALDLDGNGVIEAGELGGRLSGVERIRATAAVWCCGKDGVTETDYKTGRKKDDVYSWTYGQTTD